LGNPIQLTSSTGFLRKSDPANQFDGPPHTICSCKEFEFASCKVKSPGATRTMDELRALLIARGMVDIVPKAEADCSTTKSGAVDKGTKREVGRGGHGYRGGRWDCCRYPSRRPFPSIASLPFLDTPMAPELAPHPALQPGAEVGDSSKAKLAVFLVRGATIRPCEAGF